MRLICAKYKIKIMSKRLLLLSFIFLSAIVYVSAQTKSNLNIVVSPQLNENFSVRAGVDVDIQFNKRWSFVPGAHWSLRSRNENGTSTVNSVTTTVDYKDRSHFITVPLRCGIRINSVSNQNFALKLLFGPYLAYGIDGTSKSTEDRAGVITTKKVNAFGKEGHLCSRLDYGLNVGINGVIKQHYIIGAFGETGFRRMYEQNNLFDTFLQELFKIKNNWAFGVTLGYRF